MLQAHPDIVGVISGNDEMALGAIAALKEAGKLSTGQGRRLRRLARRGGRRSRPARCSTPSCSRSQCSRPRRSKQADNFIKTGKTGAATEKQLFDCVLITKATG